MSNKKTYKKGAAGAEQKPQTKPRKERKPKTAGRNKPLLTFLWLLFLAAFAWSIYKNFTAIDTHTIHEVEVIEAVIVDTSSIEAFTNEFAHAFHTYSTKDKDGRRDALAAYMTDPLLQLNATVVTNSDTDVSISVADFKLWGLEDIGADNYKATYSVLQRVERVITELQTEYVEETQVNEVVNPETGEVSYQEVVVQKEIQNPVEVESTETVLSSYYVVIHRDEAGDMIVIQNPTITNIPGKSGFDYTVPAANNSVDSNTAKEIEEFLTQFFTLYPQADDTQLSYYVKNGALPPIYQNYSFVDITNLVCTLEDGSITAYVTATYQDGQTGINQVSQYVLGVEKSGNWFIVSDKLV